MKKIITGFIAVLLYLSIAAQQKSFEGVAIYRNEIRSKSDLISDRAIKSLLAMSNESTVFIKKGNYKQVYGNVTIYYIANDKKAYEKFSNLDTLYYVDYTSDTAIIKDISRSKETRNIAGFECKSITIKASDATRSYFYAPELYLNPDEDNGDAIGKFNVYLKETSSLYLSTTEETPSYLLSGDCIRVKQTPVADSVFQLPSLPLKKFVFEEMISPPEFTKSGGFTKFIQSNIDNSVATKYLKVHKGEEEASQEVIVQFLVNEYGRIAFAAIENKKEIHPKLAEEALRVVNMSPLWKPAVAYNSDKTIYWMKVPIKFVVSK